jgi:hypothetical protein
LAIADTNRSEPRTAWCCYGLFDVISASWKVTTNSTERGENLKTIFRIAGVLLFLGCGGSEKDFAPNFVGLWNGTSTATINGQTASASGYTHISATGTNAIKVGDFCGNGDGPAGTVTSDSAFTVAGISCPPGPVGSCSSVVLNVSGGGGTLNGNTLTLSGSGTLSGCGTTYSYGLTFTGTR